MAALHDRCDQCRVEPATTVVIGTLAQLVILAEPQKELDEIRLRPGDEIVVPRLPRFNFRELLGVTAAVVGTLYTFDRIFGGAR